MYIKRVLTLLVAGMFFASVGGCKVTSEDIDYWRGTQKGPGKIMAVLMSSRYSKELRAEAAASLVKMERQDVHGVTQLKKALEKVKQSEPEVANEIIKELIPLLEAILTGEVKSDKSDDVGEGVQPIQVNAKDAAFTLLSHTRGDDRARLLSAVVSWFAGDFLNRQVSGNYSIEQVVQKFGAPAAAGLVDALSAEMSKEALVKIAELIGSQGDAKTKAAAAKRLVAIHTEIDGAKFKKWMADQIKASFAEQKVKVTDDRIKQTVAINAEKYMLEGALPAMKHLGKEAVVRGRLISVAKNAAAPNSPPHVVALTNSRRLSALRALEGNATEAELSVLFDLGTADPDINLRAEAFDRIEEIRSPKALPRLWPLVEGAENDKVVKNMRWKAGTMILSIEGQSALNEILKKLPNGKGVEFEPRELEGYAQRISKSNPTPKTEAELNRLLRSPDWFKKVIAIYYFGRRGGDAGEAKLKRLVADATPTVGQDWALVKQPKVGDVAKAALVDLAERKAKPAPKAVADAKSTKSDDKQADAKADGAKKENAKDKASK